MSDVTQTLSQIELASTFADEVTQQRNLNGTTASILPAVLCTNASGPQWVAKSGGMVVGTHAEGADVSDFGSSAQDPAVLGMGLYSANYHVSDEAMSRAILAGNPQGNARLWLGNMLDAVAELTSEVNNDIFNGSGGNSIIGLDTAIADSGSYANIDGTANSFWRSTVSDPGTLTALTQAQIRSDLAAIARASGQRPNIAVCNSLVFAKVSGMFDNQRQFMSLTSGQISATVSLGDFAVPTLAVDGCQFIEDTKDGYAADNNGTIYYLNVNPSNPTQGVHLEYVPYVDVAGFTSASVSGGQLPFGLDFVPLAKAGHSSKAMVRCQVQLVVPRRNRCGKRVNILTA